MLFRAGSRRWNVVSGAQPRTQLTAPDRAKPLRTPKDTRATVRFLRSVLLLFVLCVVPLRADTAYLPLVRHGFFAEGMHWATVVGVSDGDTISVNLDGCPIEGIKVRYIGIDTPERGECYWGEARDRNRELVDRQRVALERDVSEFDSWNRLLRHVYLADGTWVNGRLVREGYALVTTYPPDDRYAVVLYTLEAQARAAQVGGWADRGW